MCALFSLEYLRAGAVKGLNLAQTEVRSSLKVEVAVLGSPSLIVLTVSVDVKHHVYLYLLTVKATCDERGESARTLCQ